MLAKKKGLPRGKPFDVFIYVLSKHESANRACACMTMVQMNVLGVSHDGCKESGLSGINKLICQKSAFPVALRRLKALNPHENMCA